MYPKICKIKFSLHELLDRPLLRNGFICLHDVSMNSGFTGCLRKQNIIFDHSEIRGAKNFSKHLAAAPNCSHQNCDMFHVEDPPIWGPSYSTQLLRRPGARSLCAAVFISALTSFTPPAALPHASHRLGQCFSTSVRPRPVKFFFQKTRARS